MAEFAAEHQQRARQRLDEGGRLCAAAPVLLRRRCRVMRLLLRWLPPSNSCAEQRAGAARGSVRVEQHAAVAGGARLPAVVAGVPAVEIPADVLAGVLQARGRRRRRSSIASTWATAISRWSASDGAVRPVPGSSASASAREQPGRAVGAAADHHAVGAGLRRACARTSSAVRLSPLAMTGTRHGLLHGADRAPSRPCPCRTGSGCGHAPSPSPRPRPRRGARDPAR